MRVLYDISMFSSPHKLRAGIYNYAFELIRELVARQGVQAGTLLTSAELQFLAMSRGEQADALFAVLDPALLLPYERLDSPANQLFPWTEHDTRGLLARAANKAWRELSGLAETRWQRRRLARQAQQADLMHFLCFQAFDIALPKVATIHDVIVDLHPEWFTPEHVAQVHRVMSFYTRHIDRFLCVSETTKRDLLARYPLDPDRVRVVYPACAKSYFPEPNQAQAIEFLNTIGVGEEPFLLCLATREPRKNHAAILRAFALLLEDGRCKGTHLVVIGGTGWGLTTPLEASLPLAEQRYLHEVGFLPQPLIRGLLSRAKALVFPSLYEGFGIPPLEAMACGCPVAASRLGSLPEVLGPDAEYVDAYDPQDIARGMARLLNDPQRAQALRQAGLAWVKRYDYAQTAAETVAVYRELCPDAPA